MTVPFIRFGRVAIPGTAVVCAILIGITVPAWSQSRDVGGKREINVATVNLYVGADFEPITSADPADLPGLIAGVQAVYSRVLGSNFPVRAAALAQEIVARGPDVVALQEVSLIRRQSPGDLVSGGTVPATDVELDYLQILLDALNVYGGHYAVVSQVQDTDVEVPLVTGPFTIDDVRLTDRDVLLVRTDLPPGYLRATNPLSANFIARLPLPNGLNILRGWCSIDLQVRGRWFRVVNAHLEVALPAGLPDIQAYQAAELLAGPANTTAPVILLGDFNADAALNYGPNVYPLLTAAGGFSDAWSVTQPGVPGLTWGHDELLADPSHPFLYRLDLILYRGKGFEPTAATVVNPQIRSSSPLWFSDHAAVFGTLRIH